MQRVGLFRARYDQLQSIVHCLKAQQPSECLNGGLIPWYKDQPEIKVLRVLALQSTDDIQLNNRNKVYNQLQLLQLTSMTIREFVIDIHVVFPALKVLDVSHDLENIYCSLAGFDLTYANLLTEALLFHPSLELFISVNNDIGRFDDDSSKNTAAAIAALSSYTRAESVYALGDAEDGTIRSHDHRH